VARRDCREQVLQGGTRPNALPWQRRIFTDNRLFAAYTLKHQGSLTTA
jgi:hypothetical protein